MKPINEKSMKSSKQGNNQSEDVKPGKLKNAKVKSSKQDMKKSKVTKKVKNTKITSKVLRPKFQKHKDTKTSTKGVVYLSSIPHGFYENEMKSYFNQFGKVTGINIPRSKKSGKIKGFAFVEFLYPDVAKIVAETMNNYLMCNRIIKAQYVPPEKQKSYFFKYVRSKIPLVEKRRIYLREQGHKILSDTKVKEEQKRLCKRLENMCKNLQKIGAGDYTFTVANVPPELCQTFASIENEPEKIP